MLKKCDVCYSSYSEKCYLLNFYYRFTNHYKIVDFLTYLALLVIFSFIGQDLPFLFQDLGQLMSLLRSNSFALGLLKSTNGPILIETCRLSSPDVRGYLFWTAQTARKDQARKLCELCQKSS
jgi:hypothetical protein